MKPFILILLLPLTANANNYVMRCDDDPSKFCVVSGDPRPKGALFRAPDLSKLGQIRDRWGDILRRRFRPIDRSPRFLNCEDATDCQARIDAAGDNACPLGETPRFDDLANHPDLTPRSGFELTGPWFAWCERWVGFEIDPAKRDQAIADWQAERSAGQAERQAKRQLFERMKTRCDNTSANTFQRDVCLVLREIVSELR